MLDLALDIGSVATLHGGSLVDALGVSKTLTASGPGITCVLGGDGRYTITTDASCTTSSFVGSGDDAFAGDYLAEVEIIADANGAWFGFDNAMTSARGYGNLDECLYQNAGFGAGKTNYVKNSTFTVQNVAFTGPRLYLERVGTTVKLYQGASWAASSQTAAIISSTAVDGTARSFQFGVNTAGLVFQAKFRVVDHP